MSLETIILYLIIAAVLIGLPVFLAKKTGHNPMELLFGDRVNKTAYGKKERDSESSKASADAQSSRKKETNSSRNDLMNLISSLATYARRNHFQLIVPGTLTGSDGTTAVLAALVITRCMVIGINCFGFGGSVLAEPGESDWHQTMNGEKTVIPSPVKKNRKQLEIVLQILSEAGWPNVPVEIIGVFTSPSVQLTQKARTNCYTATGLLEYLQDDHFLRDSGLNPKELEKALQPKVLRAR